MQVFPQQAEAIFDLFGRVVLNGRALLARGAVGTTAVAPHAAALRAAAELSRCFERKQSTDDADNDSRRGRFSGMTKDLRIGFERPLPQAYAGRACSSSFLHFFYAAPRIIEASYTGVAGVALRAPSMTSGRTAQ